MVDGIRSRSASPLIRIIVCLLTMLATAGCDTTSSVEKARALQAAGRFQESLEVLRELLDERPGDSEIYYLYGVALVRMGDAGLAHWSLEEASRDPEWAVDAGIALASSSFATHNWNLAVDASTRVLEVDPLNVDALRLRAEALIEMKTDNEAALSDLEKAIELDPDRLSLRVSRAAVLLPLGRIDEAEEAIESLEALARDSYAGDAELGRLCVAKAAFAHEKGDASAADLVFEECLEEFPLNAYVLRSAMAFSDARENPERATAMLRGGLERSPESVMYRDLLAARLREAGDVLAAEQILLAGTRIQPPSLARAAWGALTDHYLALEDNVAAAEAAGRAFELEVQPGQQTILAYADVLAMAGLDERALEVAEGLEEKIYRDLVHGRVLLNQHKPEEALERFDAALARWPDNAAARYYAGRASAQSGRFDRAIREYRQSIRSGAGVTDVGLVLARLHLAEGAFWPAWIAADHHFRAYPADTEILLLRVRIAAQLQNRDLVLLSLNQASAPEVRARALVVHADRSAEEHGPGAALEFLSTHPELDLRDPGNAPALRSLVAHAFDAGAPETAGTALEAALSEHPDSSAFQAIRGFALERGGAPEGSVREAYELAVELDPQNALAIGALARLEEAHGKPKAALELYARAITASPGDLTLERSAAMLSARMGRAAEAERRLEDLLRENPHDAETAIELAKLRIARGADEAGTQELVARAKRFGGGSAAERLIEVESER